MAKVFNSPVTNDVQTVVDTAAVLHVSEFDVFHLAYEKWFGQPAPNTEIDKEFNHYMKREIVPMWGARVYSPNTTITQGRAFESPRIRHRTRARAKLLDDLSGWNGICAYRHGCDVAGILGRTRDRSCRDDWMPPSAVLLNYCY